MISKKNLLKLEKRREIYNYILENPGLHLRELSRRINISFGGLRHHLYILKKQELIIIKDDLKYTRYYATQKVGKNDKEIINLLRQDVPFRIILLLLTPGPGYIFKDDDTHKKAILKPEFHTKTYSKKELVELTKYWTGKRTHLVLLKKHRTTIDFHLKKLYHLDLIEKVKIGKEIKYKLKDEEMIWSFFIKYQNELSNECINLYMRSRNRGLTFAINNIINRFSDFFPIPFCA